MVLPIVVTVYVSVHLLITFQFYIIIIFHCYLMKVSNQLEGISRIDNTRVYGHYPVRMFESVYFICLFIIV